MSARKGEVAWQPILDRLPGRLAGQFPNTTFSVVIPPTQRWDSQQAADKILDSSYIFSTFTRERSRLLMDVTSTEQAIRELLSCHFREGSDEARAITRLLHTMSQQEPVELTKDVVLLHAHIPQVFGSTVFLGISQSPLDVPLASGEPHILIILLDPVGQDPARHLRALADIARIIRLPDMVQVLREGLRQPDLGHCPANDRQEVEPDTAAPDYRIRAMAARRAENQRILASCDP
jgi:mannitol/fructose-specific phosphotransferase system IIA component (Ntr-type)